MNASSLDDAQLVGGAEVENLCPVSFSAEVLFSGLFLVFPAYSYFSGLFLLRADIA
jgi:hypothetical protein